jgi:hypothetical protein
MKCPHCNIAIHSHLQQAALCQEDDIRLSSGGTSHAGTWNEMWQRCPECGQTIIWLRRLSPVHSGIVAPFMAYPKGYTRPIPPEVTKPYKRDFLEACLVLNDSPKASAALSRRNVQAILRDKAGTKSKDLYDQIEEVINSGKVPSYVSDGLHGVRVIGNFAAHPLKSTNTGEIMEVEDNEAEWNLDTLERLFDFYFVQPSIAAKRKAEINKKLKEAGKPQLP